MSESILFNTISRYKDSLKPQSKSENCRLRGYPPTPLFKHSSAFEAIAEYFTELNGGLTPTCPAGNNLQMFPPSHRAGTIL